MESTFLASLMPAAATISEYTTPELCLLIIPTDESWRFCCIDILPKGFLCSYWLLVPAVGVKPKNARALVQSDLCSFSGCLPDFFNTSIYFLYTLFCGIFRDVVICTCLTPKGQ
jgi:hypothetical protein